MGTLLCVALFDTNIGKVTYIPFDTILCNLLLYVSVFLPLYLCCFLPKQFQCPSRIIMEQDCGAFAADCVVLCCCCECFILQVFIFLFFKFPSKVAHKMKRFVIRRLIRKKRRFLLPAKDEISCREEGSLSGDVSRVSCMEGIEEMLHELSMEGEFVFGSFWRQGETTNNYLDFGNSQYEIEESK